MDYDYTFTTPYSGSQTIETTTKFDGEEIPKEGDNVVYWEDCKEKIDVSALASKEPILFCDERVMPNSWFLLLRFLLRVDRALMRLRETRMHCMFNQSKIPIVLRECFWREATFQDLSADEMV